MWTFYREPNQKHSSPIRKATRPRTLKTNTYGKLLTLSNYNGKLMAVDLYAGIQNFKEKISDEEIYEAWLSGDWGETLATIPWDDFPLDLEDATNNVGKTVAAAGLLSLETLPAPIHEKLRWDIKNPTIRSYINDRTASLVTGIQADTQQIIQNAVARSYSEGASPRLVASLIKRSIGLLPAQERQLANYRGGLIGQGVGGAKLDRMLDAFEDKLLTYRSMMIGRTEIRGATNTGQVSVWREAANQDLFERSTARRVWVTEGPDPCDDCLDMSGEETGLDEPWVMPDGTSVDCPPWDVHPHCYCGMELHFSPTATHEKEEDEEND